MNERSTSRLHIIPLTLSQLALCLDDISKLEDELRLHIDTAFLTERVRRAIRMKVRKMREAQPSTHAWLTYWLVIIKEENIGAGMLGFKGYMTEAVKALINWAFSHPFCETITATKVENPASAQLLKKLGAQQVSRSETATSWEIKSKVR